MKQPVAALALALSAGLAACSPQTSTGPRMEGVAEDVLADPWAALTPWDETSPLIKATSSGLQYVVLRAGPACDASPTASDRAIVHYEGRLTDGTLFDSSIARREAITFPANGVIRGWTETLGLMCPGDDFMIYLPSDLAYGEEGTPGGPIGPNADLIFRVKLLAHVTAADWRADDLQ